MINVAFEQALRQYWQETIAHEPHACAGCHTGKCCEFRVTVTDHETLTLLAGYREVITTAWPRILERAQFEARAPSLEEYTRSPVPCPLRHAGRCAVYDLRPWNCAACYLRPGLAPQVCGQHPTPDDNYTQWQHHPGTLVTLLARPRKFYRGLSLALVHVMTQLAQGTSHEAKILTLRH